MKVLAVIPARGGSKAIIGKNLKPLNGRPLIHYTLDAAAAVFPKEDICVSTDSDEIASEVDNYGFPVPFMRPWELAADTSSSHDVLLHAYRFYKDKGRQYDAIVLLQPTSPFRTADNIREAIALFDHTIDMVVSVVETEANPYFLLYEEDRHGFLHKSKKGEFVSRQQCPAVWEYNGAVYVINPESLVKQSHLTFSRVRKYVMKKIDSLDMDTQLDWEFAEFLMQKGWR